VGDTESDMQAGINAGVGRTIRLMAEAETADQSRADLTIKALNEIHFTTG